MAFPKRAVRDPCAVVHSIPLPCERETIFSVGARTRRLNAGTGANAVGRALFGCANAQHYVAVPVGLGKAQTIFGGVLTATVETLKERSVLAPLVPLLPGEKQAALLEACINSDGARAQSRSGLNRFPVTLKLLKFCRSCAREQLATGFSHWLANHQYPGAWICRTHAQLLEYVNTDEAPAWPLPQDCTGLSVQPHVSVASQLIYLKLQAATEWISTQRRVDTAVLQVMLRWRLRVAGLVRSELKWHASELRHVAKLARDYYTACQAPDVAAHAPTNWLTTALVERRHYYPLTWAMALAFSGEVDSVCLTSEYRDALARKPDVDMFDEHLRVSRRQCAPAPLYVAFATADLKRDAISASGLSEFEVDGWLQRDPELKRHWNVHLRRRRHELATGQIRTYVNARPAARRVDVLLARTQAYRWLEDNDPAALSRLLPPPVAHLALQAQLWPSFRESII